MPVNPAANEILSGKNNSSLAEIDKEVGIVGIFRPSQDVLSVVRDAIRKRVKGVWMQEGIYNKEAADEARKHGIRAVWNRCMMKEHMRLHGE